jgi:hypothetical protein
VDWLAKIGGRLSPISTTPHLNLIARRLFGQHLVHELDADGTLAYGGRNALGASRTHVFDSEHAGYPGLEQKRRAAERPFRCNEVGRPEIYRDRCLWNRSQWVRPTWRRGHTACSNNLLVGREFVEERVIELLRSRIYTAAGVE